MLVRFLDVKAWLEMDIRNASPEDGYEPRSATGSPIEEFEYEYDQPDNEQPDGANYDVSVLDWSSPVDYEAVADDSVREETPLTSPLTSPTIPKIAEKGKGPYFCDLCNKTFTNYGSYRRHLRMHYCEKKYTCHLCGRQFFRRYLWVKHQEKIHGNDPSSCRCPHCGDWSQSPDALREHLRTQHKRTNGCKENWTKDQGSPCKSPLSPAVAAPPAKKPRKKRAPKATGVNKEKRRRKSTPAVVEIKEELLSDTPVTAPDQTKEEEEKLREFDKQTLPDFNLETELKEGEDNEDSVVNVEIEDEGGSISGGQKVDDPLSPRNTSRYGRKRKQRVLFNTDMYPTSLKRFKRASLSSPARRKSMDNSNSNGFIGDGEENRRLTDIPSVSKAEASTTETQELTDGEVCKEEPAVESELSKLLQQALPNNSNSNSNNNNNNNNASCSNSNAAMPKNVSHRGNFFCDKCRRFFINRSSYMRHKKMHTGVKPFTCEYCCMSFFRSESLTNHKKKHAKENFEDFRCYLCGYKAANCASLRNHFHTVCSREKPEDNRKPHWVPADPQDQVDGKDEEGTSRNIAGYCSLCNRAFFNLSNYQRHAKLHTNMANSVPMELTYNCSFCGKIFTNRAQYDGHVLAHSKEDHVEENLVTENGIPTSLEVLKLFGNFVDKHGNSGLDDETRIKEEPVDIESLEYGAQIANNNNNNPRVMCCRLCPLAFTDRKTFLQHQKSHKGGEPLYSCYCRYCGHPQKDKSEISAHENACYETRSAENRLHHCYNCDVKFDNGSALREHVKAAHSNDREELARRNSSESLNSEKNEEDQFESTLKFVESDEKNIGKYKCGKCNETFNDIQSVVSHIQKGHGVKNDDPARKNWELNGESGTSIMKQLLSSPPASVSNYANSKSAGTSSTNKNRSRSFTCSLCLKAFDDPRVAEAHEQQAHVMVDWFQCALCEKTGGKKTMLKHMASHMLKVGSVVTTLGDQEQDSDGDTLDLGKVSFPDRTPGSRRTYGGRNHRVPPQTQATTNRDNQPPQFVSMFCQLCKKVISSLATLERHRHASQDPTVSYPYICCMPGCGKCFALKVEAVAHLQTLHKGSLTPSLSSVAQPSTSTSGPTPSTRNTNQDNNQRSRWLLGNSWKGLVAGGVGPFSQSLVQLSMAVAGKDTEATRGAKNVTGKRDGNLIDIYQSNALENLTSNGELTITKVAADVEEITVEPLLECVLEEDDENQVINTEDGGADESMVMALSPGMVHEDLEEGEIPDGESPSPLKDQLRVNNKVLLQCEDCQSVFTNPCSWKRHRKLHLGIMKHKCTFCPRKFYRKDHCDKHVKTHENCSIPRRRKSPVNIKIEPGLAASSSTL